MQRRTVVYLEKTVELTAARMTMIRSSRWRTRLFSLRLVFTRQPLGPVSTTSPITKGCDTGRTAVSYNQLDTLLPTFLLVGKRPSERKPRMDRGCLLMLRVDVVLYAEGLAVVDYPAVPSSGRGFLRVIGKPEVEACSLKRSNPSL